MLQTYIHFNIKLDNTQQKEFERRQTRRMFESISVNVTRRICVFLYGLLAKSLIFPFFYLTAVRITRFISVPL